MKGVRTSRSQASIGSRILACERVGIAVLATMWRWLLGPPRSWPHDHVATYSAGSTYVLHQCCFLANLFVVTNVISMQRDLTLKQATTYVTIVQLMYGMQVAMRSVTFNVKDQSHSIKLGCFSYCGICVVALLASLLSNATPSAHGAHGASDSLRLESQLSQGVVCPRVPFALDSDSRYPMQGLLLLHAICIHTMALPRVMTLLIIVMTLLHAMLCLPLTEASTQREVLLRAASLAIGAFVGRALEGRLGPENARFATPHIIHAVNTRMRQLAVLAHRLELRCTSRFDVALEREFLTWRFRNTYYSGLGVSSALILVRVAQALAKPELLRIIPAQIGANLVVIASRVCLHLFVAEQDLARQMYSTTICGVVLMAVSLLTALRWRATAVNHVHYLDGFLPAYALPFLVCTVLMDIVGICTRQRVPTLVLSLLIIWAGMPTYLARGERLKYMAALACAIVAAELVALLLRRRARRKFLDSCAEPVQVHSRAPIFEGRTTFTGFALAHSPSPAFRQEPNARTLGWQWLPFSSSLLLSAIRAALLALPDITSSESAETFHFDVTLKERAVGSTSTLRISLHGTDQGMYCHHVDVRRISGSSSSYHTAFRKLRLELAAQLHMGAAELGAFSNMREVPTGQRVLSE